MARPPATLDRAAVEAIYDRHGRKQDGAGWYEDPPLRRLMTHLALGEASAVLELGAGTGRFAEWLLDAMPDATYTAVDLSGEMCRLAGERLARFGDRVTVLHGPTDAVELPDGGFDRVVSAYMFDIWPEDAIADGIESCHQWLRPDGILGLVSLTDGETWLGRAVSSLWTAVHRRWPHLVGGCRPLQQARLLEPSRWHVEHRSVVRAWGIPSEVLVARRR